MDATRVGEITAGGAIFSRLKALGVDYVFTNSGTDFPPIIEGLAEAEAKHIDLPRALVIPHEHAAMGMAHGYYLMTGRAQAVMLHTNVGLANGAIGAINAACEQIPMLLMSGRTPVSESGRFGARTVPIAWGQEMRDQAALVRESCKWDYELRFPEQIGELLDRGWAIANSTPKGPIYLSLPREVLCEPIDSGDLTAPPSMMPVAGAPDPDAIRKAAKWLVSAKAPLVIAQRGAGDGASFEIFSELAKKYGIAVCSWWATHLAISTEHPCHIGADPGERLAEADVVVILNSLAPWWPDRHHPHPDARIINIGPDPIFSRFPVRNFKSHLSIGGELATTVPALATAMDALGHDKKAAKKRRKRLAEISDAHRERLRRDATENAARGITKAHVSLVLGELLDGLKSSVFSELGTQLGTLVRRDHRSWFQEPHSGGLGWSFPTAMGAQLADPERICVATMGDGSYMFANPIVCHHIAEALELPVLVVVLNNGEYGAVRGSVAGMYPRGHAVTANRMPLTALQPSPEFIMAAAASRAWVRQVSDPSDLRNTLELALKAVRDNRRQAFVEVKVLPD